MTRKDQGEDVRRQWRKPAPAVPRRTSPAWDGQDHLTGDTEGGGQKRRQSGYQGASRRTRCDGRGPGYRRIRIVMESVVRQCQSVPKNKEFTWRPTSPDV